MNLPTDNDGKKMFYEQLAKLQAKLVAESIKKLDVDNTSKEKVFVGVLELLNEKIKEEVKDE